MSAIRVLLGTMPSMFRSMIADILATAPDIEVVAPAVKGDASRRSLREIMGREQVDVVVLRSPAVDEYSDMLAGLVHAAPVGVVAIEEDGLVGALYQLRRAPVDFTTTGRLALLDAIRVASRTG